MKNAFALSEMLVVIAVTGIIAAVLLLLLPPIIGRTDRTTDFATLKTLNRVSVLYKMNQNISGSDVFNGLTTDSARLTALFDAGNIDRIPVANIEGNIFVWSIPEQKWDILHVVSGTEVDVEKSGGFTGFITGSYDGDEKDIKIPASIDGTAVTVIYQDVFNGKGLTSVVIEEGITRIHARAFKDNDLTELVLPDSLTRLDYGAFMDNPLTKVTIGPNVIKIEGGVFPNNESFTAAYNAGGAGTYILIGGVWFKQ